MKDSQTWWDETKINPDKLNKWLQNQYHGEKLASWRISDLQETLGSDISGYDSAVLKVISMQENRHAIWIGNLLRIRGFRPSILENKTERYWKKTLPDGYEELPYEEIAAIGAHAEAMRLERIKVIANDPSAPIDIRIVFQNILPEEIFHEYYFRTAAGLIAMEAMKDNHQAGLDALGLTI